MTNSMKIGIIGAGNIAQAFAKHAGKAGYEVAISNSRGPETLRQLAQELGSGITPVTVQEAAQADFVMIAVRSNQLRAALADLPDWNSRIVLDATNGLITRDYEVDDPGGKTSSEFVAELVPGAKVVKAFNTLFSAVLAADPLEAGGQRVIFISGDDIEAKRAVGGVIEKIGFAAIDLGTLAVGGKLQQFPGGPLAAINLLKMP
jgi:8-hydroxy-5-deazaflavin:NADPH oxidoreductase